MTNESYKNKPTAGDVEIKINYEAAIEQAEQETQDTQMELVNAKINTALDRLMMAAILDRLPPEEAALLYSQGVIDLHPSLLPGSAIESLKTVMALLADIDGIKESRAFINSELEKMIAESGADHG